MFSPLSITLIFDYFIDTPLSKLNHQSSFTNMHFCQCLGMMETVILIFFYLLTIFHLNFCNLLHVILTIQSLLHIHLYSTI